MTKLRFMMKLIEYITLGMTFEHLLWVGARQPELAVMYLDEETADVKFDCGIDDDDTDEVPAHKVILTMYSPVFKAMFYGGLPEGVSIRISDVTVDGFKQFLQYFYQETMKLSIEYAGEVIYLAKKYGIKNYLDTIIEFLEKNLTNDRMFECLEVAMSLDLPQLKTFCLNQIIQNHKQLFNTEAFVSCSAEILKIILETDEMKSSSEEMFIGYFKWAQNAWKHQNVQGHEPNLSDIRSQMNDFIDLIEFSSMSGQAITSLVSEFGDFFTKDDLKKIHSIVAIKYPRSLDTTMDFDTQLLQPITVDTMKKYINDEIVMTSFLTSKKIYLFGYRCARIFNDWAIPSTFGPIWVTIVKKSSHFDNGEIVLHRHNLSCSNFNPFLHPMDNYIEVTFETISIEPNIEYEIRVKVKDFVTKCYYTTSSTETFDKCPQNFNNMEVLIKQHGIISRLSFKIH